MVLPESLVWHRKTGVEDRFRSVQDNRFVLLTVSAGSLNFVSRSRDIARIPTDISLSGDAGAVNRVRPLWQLQRLQQASRR